MDDAAKDHQCCVDIVKQLDSHVKRMQKGYRFVVNVCSKIEFCFGIVWGIYVCWLMFYSEGRGELNLPLYWIALVGSSFLFIFGLNKIVNTIARKKIPDMPKFLSELIREYEEK